MKIYVDSKSLCDVLYCQTRLVKGGTSYIKDAVLEVKENDQDAVWVHTVGERVKVSLRVPARTEGTTSFSVRAEPFRSMLCAMSGEVVLDVGNYSMLVNESQFPIDNDYERDAESVFVLDDKDVTWTGKVPLQELATRLRITSAPSFPTPRHFAPCVIGIRAESITCQNPYIIVRMFANLPDIPDMTWPLEAGRLYEAVGMERDGVLRWSETKKVAAVSWPAGEAVINCADCQHRSDGWILVGALGRPAVQVSAPLLQKALSQCAKFAKNDTCATHMSFKEGEARLRLGTRNAEIYGTLRMGVPLDAPAQEDAALWMNAKVLLGSIRKMGLKGQVLLRLITESRMASLQTPDNSLLYVQAGLNMSEEITA